MSARQAGASLPRRRHLSVFDQEYPSDIAMVDRLPTDAPRHEPEPGIALCLSGGGYKAALFHLGALWRLNELGYLSRLSRIASVSGGSIAAATLAINWGKLDFDADGVANAFANQVAYPLRTLARHTIDVRVALQRLVGLNNGSRAAPQLAKYLLGTSTLQDLPDNPTFIFNATNLQSGVLWRFQKAYLADYLVGRIDKPRTLVSVAVAASAATPPFLSPVVLRFNASDFVPDSGLSLQRAPYTTKVALADGSLLDTLGLETVWKRYSTILISDGGAVDYPQGNVSLNWALQLPRVVQLTNSRTSGMIKRQAINAFVERQRKGTYWGIGSSVYAFSVKDPLPCPPAATSMLAQLPGRLGALDSLVQERLINWGYAIADAAIRSHLDVGLPRPPNFPYPSARV
jgi:NTE family protein